MLFLSINAASVRLNGAIECVMSISWHRGKICVNFPLSSATKCDCDPKSVVRVMIGKLFGLIILITNVDLKKVIMKECNAQGIY